MLPNPWLIFLLLHISLRDIVTAEKMPALTESASENRGCINPLPCLSPRPLQLTSSVVVSQPSNSIGGNTSYDMDKGVMLSPRFPILLTATPKCVGWFNTNGVNCGVTTCCMSMVADGLITMREGDWAVDKKNGTWELHYKIKPEMFQNQRFKKYQTAPFNFEFWMWNTKTNLLFRYKFHITGTALTDSRLQCKRANTKFYDGRLVVKPGESIACLLQAKGYAPGSEKTKISAINASPADFSSPYLTYGQGRGSQQGQRVSDSTIGRFTDMKTHTEDESGQGVAAQGQDIRHLKMLLFEFVVENGSEGGTYCVGVDLRPASGVSNGKMEPIKGSKNACFEIDVERSLGDYAFYIALVIVLVIAGAIAFLKLTSR